MCEGLIQTLPKWMTNGFTFTVDSRSYTLGQLRDAGHESAIGVESVTGRSGALFSVTGDANIIVQLQKKLKTDMTTLDGSTEDPKRCEDANAISKLKPQSYMNCVKTGAILVRGGRDATREILAEDAELRKCYKLNTDLNCLDKFKCDDPGFGDRSVYGWNGYLDCGIRGETYSGCQHDYWKDGKGGRYHYWCSNKSPYKGGDFASWVDCTWDDACGEEPKDKEKFVTYKYTIWRAEHAVGTGLEKLLSDNPKAPAAEFANLNIVLQIFSDISGHLKSLVIDSPKDEHRLLGLDNLLVSEARVDVLALLICRCSGEACMKFDGQSQPDYSKCVRDAENDEKSRIVSSSILLFNVMIAMISVPEMRSRDGARLHGFNKKFIDKHLPKLIYHLFWTNRPGPPLSQELLRKFENVTVEDATAEFLEKGLRENYRADVAACIGFERALASMFTWYGKWIFEKAPYGEGSDEWPPAWISDFHKLLCAASEASSLGLQSGVATLLGMLFVFGLAGFGWVQLHKRRDPRNPNDGQGKTLELELVESY